MTMMRMLATGVISLILGIGGGVLIVEIEVASIKAQIAAVEADNLSYEAELLITAIDKVMAYRADPDNHTLTFSDVMIVNEWIRHGI